MSFRDRMHRGGLCVAAGLLLLTGCAVACGGSDAKDTRGGLVGRMSHGCVLTLASIDDASLHAGTLAGTRRQAAIVKASVALAEATEVRCLEQITDWSLAVAQLEKRLALAAKSAGKTTPTVSCDAPEVWVREVAGVDIAGFVAEATTDIRISPWACLDLARLVGHPGRLSCLSLKLARRCPASLALEAIAVVVLAHEQQHVDGESNEALAQCYAYQRAQAVARQLGVPRRAAARLAAFVKQAITQPFVYSSIECRRGGSFDLRLPGPWPLTPS
jgi:hypothetical protein